MPSPSVCRCRISEAHDAGGLGAKCGAEPKNLCSPASRFRLDGYAAVKCELAVLISPTRAGSERAFQSPSQKLHLQGLVLVRVVVRLGEGLSNLSRALPGGRAAHTIFSSTFFMSANEKARSVSDRTKPREETLSKSAVAVSSSGASQMVTMSCLPSVQYMSLTVTPFFLAIWQMRSD